MEFSQTHPKKGEVKVRTDKEKCGCYTENYSAGTQVVFICRGHGARSFIVPPVKDMPHLA